ncbi:hypothetical protein TWF694_011422 [Orbilia ellipsospora]|uniref:Zn(2)-C6 fungal-type domain-containing protein n=1 Tax=Orbilia ellipsospora TaxID=2528407 RepID=A0AAV9X5F8_9PEZI
MATELLLFVSVHLPIYYAHKIIIIRIRHKRCDEQKPICQNCQKTSRVCDGYIDETTGLRYGGQQSHTSDSQIVKSPSQLRFSTEREAQGFRFFENISALQLAHALGSYDWSTFILQSAHQNRTLLHGIIGIGSLCKKLEVNDHVISNAPDAKALHEFALEQYFEAISGLRSALDNSSGDVLPQESVLLASILFVIFEFLQGNADGAIIHLRSGFQIASNLEDSSLARRMQILLAMMDMTMTVWLGKDRGYSGSGISFHLISTTDLGPSRPGVQACMNELMLLNNDVQSIRHAEACDISSSLSSNMFEPGFNFNNEKHMLRLRLYSWYQTFFRTYFEDKYASTTLHASYLMTQLLLGENSDFESFGNNVDDTITSKYEKIVRIIEEALVEVRPPRRFSLCAEDGLEDVTLLPVFSFRFSFAQPLFFVARTAPDINLRLRAIDILLRDPWREGAWDSGALGLIARQSLPHNP